MKTLRFLFLLLFILSLLYIGVNAQVADTAREFINFRRTDPNNLPAPEKYSQPKEEVFPLGWNKGTLGKVTSGTGIWTELNPLVPRTNYIGLHFVNKDTGWACGGSGAIIKTMDGGETWTISETPVNNLILKIHSYNRQIVIATGYDGIILRSSDGGETFEQVVSGVGSGIDLWGVQMVNDTLGWVCGLNQTLLKTINGGLTWLPVNAGLNQHYWSLDFLNEQYGMIACGGGKVLKTTDGGINWIQIQAGDERSLYTIDIIDSLHVTAAGERELQIQYEGGKNVYSSDAGVTWVQNPDIPTYTDANWIEFIDTDTGYAITVSHGIYKTTNRGQNWFSVGGGGEWHLNLTDNGTGYSGGNGLNIFKRTDGLENWSRIFLNDNFSDVFFINEQKGFIISWSGLSTPSGLYKTNNGGMNWEIVPGAPNGPELLFLDSLTGFIGSNLIYKTTDGGVNWYVPNGGSGGAGKIFFINETIGWAIRSNIIYKTTDRGENWFVQLTAPGARSFSGIHFVDTLYGWASGVRPQKTTDGGNTWVEQTNTIIWNSDDVYFTNIDTGWIGKYSSIFNSLFKTTDGGLNWNGIPEVIGARKFYFFPDPIHWMIIGFSQYYITNDFGNSWLEFTGEVTTGLVSFYAPTNNLGYAVGNNGLVLKYDDTTYIPVELISFNGRSEDNKIILEWITASEINNYGFEIQRTSFSTMPVQEWITIGFVEGRGTTTEKQFYSFSDKNLITGKYQYRLKQIDFDGSFEYSEIIEVEIGVPSVFYLSQNYPNPFNPETTIDYKVPIKTFVNISLFDIKGEKIRELVNEEKQPGYYAVKLKGEELSSGIYFYRLVTGSGYTTVKKLTIIK